MIPLIFIAAVAGAVPNYDIDAICKSAATLSNDQNAIAGCVQDEKSAKDKLIKEWTSYPAAARRECMIDSTSLDLGHSYVELVTCFEMQDWKAHLDDVGGPRVPGAHGPQLK